MMSDRLDYLYQRITALILILSLAFFAISIAIFFVSFINPTLIGLGELFAIIGFIIGYLGFIFTLLYIFCLFVYNCIIYYRIKIALKDSE